MSTGSNGVWARYSANPEPGYHGRFSFSALARKIDRKDMMPEVQLDLWALTTIIALQQQGYVLIAP